MPGLPARRSSSAADVRVALAAPASGEIVFEIRVAFERLERDRGRPAEIGVQDDAGRVDHASQARLSKRPRLRRAHGLDANRSDPGLLPA